MHKGENTHGFKVHSCAQGGHNDLCQRSALKGKTYLSRCNFLKQSFLHFKKCTMAWNGSRISPTRIYNDSNTEKGDIKFLIDFFTVMTRI